ncbi:MAG: GTPase HflX [Planctomycetes bacterium]|nr:GTPase HflX [Planctomycetota bacterium]
MSRASRPTGQPRERALVVGVRLPTTMVSQTEAHADLSEAVGLLEAAEAEVVGEGLLQRVQKPSPATLFGKGKVEEIRLEVERLEPDLVLVDNDLSPAQARNLEKSWGVRILDRSELILDIFARRAKTQQARLQVELAQMEYMAPRLRRMWTHLERMEGAIGTRGPGETQLETDKRLIKERIKILKDELEEIEARKQREVKTRADQFTIGLVGYTNAGKSTLLNRLTGSTEFVADMLFATLDTRTRQWRLSDGRTVLLSDTVGFLQRLPHHLVASFHATLEETLHSDMLLHIIDGSHPDAAAQMEAVENVFAELKQDLSDAILVFNKIDRLPDRLALQYLRGERKQESVQVSAATGAGLADLERIVRTRLDQRSTLFDVLLPMSEGRFESQLRRLCQPLEDDWDEARNLRRLRVRLTDGALGSLRRGAHPGILFEPVEPVSGR